MTRKPSHRSLILPAILAAFAGWAALGALPVASAHATTFSNTTPIAIPAQGSANPYPSPIQVSGTDGPIRRMVLTLHGVTHPNPQDLDILLVSPSGRKASVVSDSCGSLDVTNRTWVFATYGSFDYMPKDGPCPSGAYRTTNYDIGANGDSWPGAPEGGLHSFEEFQGHDPTGTWALHVVDDSGFSAGSIQGGWSLDIETTPADVRIPMLGSFGIADPYPLTRTVSGQDGVITDVDVFVNTLSHRRPDDIDMYLVGPHGQKAKLMSDACGEPDIVSRTWTFNDEALNAMPDAPASACGSPTQFRPSDYEAGESPPGGPPGPYPASLAGFDLTDPNGDWRLYVYDDADGEAGFFADGNPVRSVPFNLIFTTRPRAKVAFAEGDAAVDEGQARELTLSRPDPGGGLGAGAVTVTSAPLSAGSGSDFKPVSTTVEFAPGQTTKTVSVEALADALPDPAETFELRISQASGDADPATPSTAVVTIQDRGSAGAGGTDREAPLIRGLALRPRAFAVARRGKSRGARRGTTIRYSLSEPARVTFALQRRAGGRGGRYVRIGTLRQAGRAGLNRKAFNGRVGRRALRPGAYRLTLTAVDGAGNRSSSRPKRFRIVR